MVLGVLLSKADNLLALHKRYLVDIIETPTNAKACASTGIATSGT